MKEFAKKLLSRFGLYLSKGYKTYFFTNRKIVQREIYGRTVKMPKSHSIIYNLANFPHYNSNLQRLTAQYTRYRPGSFSIVDVGSNIGDTLMMLRQVTNYPVHCFEGDPFFSQLLEQNAAGIPNCHIHKLLLAEQPGSIMGKSQTGLGTSQFVSTEEGGVNLEFSSIDHFFSRHFPDETIGLIKTDTDGFDLKVLRGAAVALKRDQPIIFLEYDRSLFEPNGDEGLGFLQFLASLGYHGLMAYDNFGRLVAVTTLDDDKVVRSLHAYIKDRKGAFPFYDLAIFSGRDDAFFKAFSAGELTYFEQGLPGGAGAAV